MLYFKVVFESTGYFYSKYVPSKTTLKCNILVATLVVVDCPDMYALALRPCTLGHRAYISLYYFNYSNYQLEGCDPIM